ncbi:MAG: hypothetical protein NT069_23975 [Planctomycetota bacterium]|nr:hypothetical protein [Planctomycetota bacterium]
MSKARVITYSHPTSVLDVVLGSAKAKEPATPWQTLLDASVPRAMYLCSWNAQSAE